MMGLMTDQPRAPKSLQDKMAEVAETARQLLREQGWTDERIDAHVNRKRRKKNV
jgi:hypothetical protein